MGERALPEKYNCFFIEDLFFGLFFGRRLSGFWCRRLSLRTTHEAIIYNSDGIIRVRISIRFRFRGIVTTPLGVTIPEEYGFFRFYARNRLLFLSILYLFFIFTITTTCIILSHRRIE